MNCVFCQSELCGGCDKCKGTDCLDVCKCKPPEEKTKAMSEEYVSALGFSIMTNRYLPAGVTIGVTKRQIAILNTKTETLVIMPREQCTFKMEPGETSFEFKRSNLFDFSKLTIFKHKGT